MDDFTGDSKQTASSHRLPARSLGRKTKLAAQLLGLGYAIDEVADQLGMERSHLLVLRRSRLFQTEMAKAQERFLKREAQEVKEKIWKLAPDAVSTVEEVMGNEKEKGATRLLGAKMVLDRVVPLSREGTADTPKVVINIGTDKAVNIQNALAEDEEMEPPVEAEFTEVDEDDL